MDAAQMQDQTSKRVKAINELCEVATKHGLAFAVGEDEMIIKMPALENVPLPVVGTIPGDALKDDDLDDMSTPMPEDAAPPTIDESKSENEA